MFNGFVIQGGSRGIILIISFGMKFAIIFKKRLVNVLTCQLGITKILHKTKGKTTLDSRMKIYLSIPAANTEHKRDREGRRS